MSEPSSSFLSSPDFRNFPILPFPSLPGVGRAFVHFLIFRYAWKIPCATRLLSSWCVVLYWFGALAKRRLHFGGRVMFGLRSVCFEVDCQLLRFYNEIEYKKDLCMPAQCAVTWTWSVACRLASSSWSPLLPKEYCYSEYSCSLKLYVLWYIWVIFAGWPNLEQFAIDLPYRSSR